MNTPNKITLTRILMIPLIVFFYLSEFIPYGRLVATILFIIASLTDFLDGYLARKNNQVTTLGKFFDSIADKVLTATGLILIVAVPINGATIVYPTWLGVVCTVIILAREFIISSLRQLAAAKGIVLAADMSGKVKTTVQFLIITAYMAFAFAQTDLIEVTAKTPTPVAIIRFVFMIILIGATFLTIYSGAGYLIRNRHVFKENQENYTPKKVEKTEKKNSVTEKSEAKQIENKEEDKNNENKEKGE